ncbi:MAG: DUF3293 domain-containing protein [Gemmatimonadaceae bacterium]|nr:DUF3293 domain-containing protein [Gemmatimonadaceae bacterium]
MTTPLDDPRWEHYANTLLRFFAHGSLIVDLRHPMPAETIALLASHHVGPTFAVVTACNPLGRNVDDTQNTQLTHLLTIDIAAHDCAWVPADGMSPDGRHVEPGVAASLPRDDARALAREYDQLAFFWFDGVAMWLIGAVVDTPDRRLP